MLSGTIQCMVQSAMDKCTLQCEKRTIKQRTDPALSKANLAFWKESDFAMLEEPILTCFLSPKTKYPCRVT